MEDEVGHISRCPIVKNSGSQASGTDCVLLVTEWLWRNVEWRDAGIRFMDKKEHFVSVMEDAWGGVGRRWGRITKQEAERTKGKPWQN